MEQTQAYFTAAHSSALPADGSVPEWVHLIPAGPFSGRDGRGPYQLDGKSVLEIFAQWGADLSVDYEHQSLNTLDNGQPAPAAGWVKSLELRDDGIWGRVEWTDRAAAMIAAREYRYLSPVFDYDRGGVVFRLLNVGLTNNPNLYLTALNRREGFSSAHSTKGGNVDLKDIIERLRYMLNLPSLATPEEVVAELDKLKALIGQPETQAMRQALALPDTAGVGEIIRAAHGRVTGAPDPGQYIPRAEYDRVAHSLQQLQQQTADNDVEKAVREAMAAGKVAPASADWARSYCRRDPKGFAEFVSAAPALVGSGDAASAAHAQGKPPAKAEINPLIADAERRAGK